MRDKLVIFTNWKSHTGFRLVPVSVTLNDRRRAITAVAELLVTLVKLHSCTEAHTHTAFTAYNACGRKCPDPGRQVLLYMWT